MNTEATVTDKCSVCATTYETTSERAGAGVTWCGRECRSVHRRLASSRRAMEVAYGDAPDGYPDVRPPDDPVAYAAAAQRWRAAWNDKLALEAPHVPSTAAYLAFLHDPQRPRSIDPLAGRVRRLPPKRVVGADGRVW